MPRSTLTRRLSALALACTLSACDGADATGPATPREPPPAPVVHTPPPPVAAKPEPPAPDTPAGKVQLAAVVAREIAAAPELADDILDRHGLDRDRFDAMIFEIAGDPELTKAYMAARRTR